MTLTADAHWFLRRAIAVVFGALIVELVLFNLPSVATLFASESELYSSEVSYDVEAGTVRSFFEIPDSEIRSVLVPPCGGGLLSTRPMREMDILTK